MPTVGSDCDVIIDGKGYLIVPNSYEEGNLIPHVVKTAAAGQDPKYDDLTGPQFISIPVRGGIGHKFDSNGIYHSEFLDTRLDNKVRRMPYETNYGYLTGGTTSTYRTRSTEFSNSIYWLISNKTYSYTGLAGHDHFNRADSTTSLGKTDSPSLSWTAVAGTWGISSNGAYPVTAASGDLAVITPATLARRISARILWSSGGAGYIVFRYQNSSNYFYAGIDTDGKISLHKVVATVDTSLGTYAAGFTGGSYVLYIEDAGTTVTVYYGPTAVIAPVSDSALNTQVGIGFLNKSTTVSYFGTLTYGGLAVLSNTLGSGVRGKCLQVYKNSVWAGHGSTAYISSFDAATWVNSGTDYADELCVWDNKLILAYSYAGTTTIKSTTGATAAAATWTTVATIEGGGTVTSLCVYYDRNGDPAVYIGMTNGLYLLNYQAGQTEQVIDFGSVFSYNAAGMCVWQGYLYVPWRGSVLKVSPSSVEIVGPPADDERIVTTTGWFVYLHPTVDYLYASYLGRSRTISSSCLMCYDGTDWHNLRPFNDIDSTYVRCLDGLSVDSSGILHYAAGMPELGAYHLNILISPSPAQDSTGIIPMYSATTANALLMSSWTSAGKDRVNKSWLDLTFVGSGLSSTSSYIDVYYQTDFNTADTIDTASWTSLGTFNSGTTQTLSFTSIHSKSIRFLLLFRSTGNFKQWTTSPVLQDLVLRYDVIPDERLTCSMTIRVEDYGVGIAGMQETRTAKVIWADLTASMAKIDPISFTTPFNIAMTVRPYNRKLRLLLANDATVSAGKAQVVFNEVG